MQFLVHLKKFHFTEFSFYQITCNDFPVLNQRHRFLWAHGTFAQHFGPLMIFLNSALDFKAQTFGNWRAFKNKFENHWTKNWTLSKNHFAVIFLQKVLKTGINFNFDHIFVRLYQNFNYKSEFSLQLKKYL